jgi:hypothetical protein
MAVSMRLFIILSSHSAGTLVVIQFTEQDNSLGLFPGTPAGRERGNASSRLPVSHTWKTTRYTCRSTEHL